MPEPPDFDQLAQRMADALYETVDGLTQPRDLGDNGIAMTRAWYVEQLRQVWNARPVPRCDECRFWREPKAAFEVRHPEWRDCEKAIADDGRIALDPQGWDTDGGAVMTAPDFGCVQWEPRPSPAAVDPPSADPGTPPTRV